jgi:hypothetical protein
VRVEAWAPVPELYAVEVVLHDTVTDDRLEAAEADNGMPVLPPVVGQARIAPARPLSVAPHYTSQADFGPVQLIGYEAPLTAHPGEAVPLTLYWRAVGALAQNYTIFVHLMTESGQLVAQADAQPRSGAYPTSAWTPGDVIPDTHTLALPASLPPGEYALRVGLYAAPDGPRLALKPSGDTLTLGTVRVR